MLLLAYGIVRLERRGEELGPTLGVLAAGSVMVAAFIVIERRADAPPVRDQCALPGGPSHQPCHQQLSNGQAAQVHCGCYGAAGDACRPVSWRGQVAVPLGCVALPAAGASHSAAVPSAQVRRKQPGGERRNRS